MELADDCYCKLLILDLKMNVNNRQSITVKAYFSYVSVVLIAVQFSSILGDGLAPLF